MPAERGNAEAVNVEFRKRDDGSYFPPVLPNGDFIGVAHGSTQRQVLFAVKDDGLHAAGVFYLWEDITGISITEAKGFQILSSKYRNGGIGFEADGSALLDAEGEIVTRIGGYTVDYCLMNRISFENSRNL